MGYFDIPDLSKDLKAQQSAADVPPVADEVKQPEIQEADFSIPDITRDIKSAEQERPQAQVTPQEDKTSFDEIPEVAAAKQELASIESPRQSFSGMIKTGLDVTKAAVGPLVDIFQNRDYKEKDSFTQKALENVKQDLGIKEEEQAPVEIKDESGMQLPDITADIKSTKVEPVDVIANISSQLMQAGPKTFGEKEKESIKSLSPDELYEVYQQNPWIYTRLDKSQQDTIYDQYNNSQGITGDDAAAAGVAVAKSFGGMLRAGFDLGLHSLQEAIATPLDLVTLTSPFDPKSRTQKSASQTIIDVENLSAGIPATIIQTQRLIKKIVGESEGAAPIADAYAQEAISQGKQPNPDTLGKITAFEMALKADPQFSIVTKLADMAVDPRAGGIAILDNVNKALGFINPDLHRKHFDRRAAFDAEASEYDWRAAQGAPAPSPWAQALVSEPSQWLVHQFSRSMLPSAKAYAAANNIPVEQAESILDNQAEKNTQARIDSYAKKLSGTYDPDMEFLGSLALGEAAMGPAGLALGAARVGKLGIQSLETLGMTKNELAAYNASQAVRRMQRAKETADKAAKAGIIGKIAGGVEAAQKAIPEKMAQWAETLPTEVQALAPYAGKALEKIALGTAGFEIGAAFDPENPMRGALTGLTLGQFAGASPALVRSLSDTRRYIQGGIGLGKGGFFETAGKLETSSPLTRGIFGGGRGEAIDYVAKNAIPIMKSGASLGALNIATSTMNSDDAKRMIEAGAEGFAMGGAFGLIHGGVGLVGGRNAAEIMRDRKKQDVEIYLAMQRADEPTKDMLSQIGNFENRVSYWQGEVDRTQKELAEAVASGDQAKIDEAKKRADATQALHEQLSTANIQTRSEYGRHIASMYADLQRLANGARGEGQGRINIRILPQHEIYKMLVEKNARDGTGLTEQQIMDLADASGNYNPKTNEAIINGSRIMDRMMKFGESPIDALVHEGGGHVLFNIPEFREKNKKAEALLFGEKEVDLQGRILSKTDGIFSDEDLVKMFDDYTKNQTPEEKESYARGAGIWNEQTKSLDPARTAEYMKEEVIAELIAGNLKNGLVNLKKTTGSLDKWITGRMKQSILARSMHEMLGRGVKPFDSKLLGAENNPLAFSPEAIMANREAISAIADFNGRFEDVPDGERGKDITEKEMRTNPVARKRYALNGGEYKTQLVGTIKDSEGKVVAKVPIENPNAAEGMWQYDAEGNKKQMRGYGQVPDEFAGMTPPAGGSLEVSRDFMYEPDGKTPIRNTDKELADIEKSRGDMIREALDSADDYDSPQRLRPFSADGLSWSGIMSPKQIENIKNIPESILPLSIKEKILQFNEMLALDDGKTADIDYAPRLGKSRKYKGRRSEIYHIIPVGFGFSKEGNFYLRTISLNALFRKVRARKERMPNYFAAWDNNTELFMKELQDVYLKNTKEGREGWMGLDPAHPAEKTPLAETKMNRFNDMLNLLKAGVERVNPEATITPKAKGQRRAEDLDTLWRTHRLDAIADIADTTEVTGTYPIGWERVYRNLMPREADETRAREEERRPQSEGNVTASLYESGTSLESFGKEALSQLAEFYGVATPENATRGEIIDSIKERSQLGITAERTPERRPFGAQYVAPKAQAPAPKSDLFFMPASAEIREEGSKQHLEFWNRELENSGIKEKPTTMAALDKFIHQYVGKRYGTMMAMPNEALEQGGVKPLFPTPDSEKIKAYYEKVVRNATPEQAINFPENWRRVRNMSDEEFNNFFSQDRVNEITKSRVETLAKSADYLLEEMKAANQKEITDLTRQINDLVDEWNTEENIQYKEEINNEYHNLQEKRKQLQDQQDRGSYTPAEVAAILDASAKVRVRTAQDEDGNLVPVKQKITNGNEVVPNEVSGATASRIAEYMRQGMGSENAYVQGVFDTMKARAEARGTYTGWKKYDQTDNMGEAEKLNADLAGTNWCTGGAVSTAHQHLTGGDFYVYFDEGEPQVAIRTEGGQIAEVRGRGEGQNITTAKYDQAAEEFIRSGKGPEGGENYLYDRNFRKMAVEIMKTGRVPEEAYKYYNQLGIFTAPKPKMSYRGEYDQEYIEAFRKNAPTINDVFDEKTGVLKTSYDYSFRDKERDKYRVIKGDINSPQGLPPIGEGVVDLPNLEECGNIDAASFGSVFLPKLKKSGFLNFKRVEGDIDLRSLETAGDVLVNRYGSDLNLPKLKNCSDLIASNTKKIYAPNLEVCRNIDFTHRGEIYLKELTLPKLEKAGRILADYSNSVVLPKLKECTNLFAVDSGYLYAPELEKVESINGALTTIIPKLSSWERIKADRVQEVVAPMKALLDFNIGMISEGQVRFINSDNGRIYDFDAQAKPQFVWADKTPDNLPTEIKEDTLESGYPEGTKVSAAAFSGWGEKIKTGKSHEEIAPFPMSEIDGAENRKFNRIEREASPYGFELTFPDGHTLFVSRQNAFKVAKAAGQLKKPVTQEDKIDMMRGVLHSSMVNYEGGKKGEISFMPSSKEEKYPTSERGFYSGLQKTIDEKMPAKASPQQILSIVNNPQNAKPEEVKWSNLAGFLEGKQSVTKQEVLDYLKNEGSVKFEERTLGGKLQYNEESEFLKNFPEIKDIYENSNNAADFRLQLDNSSTLYDELKRKGYGELADDPAFAHKIASDIFTHEPVPTKYSQYTLPNGENYREVVLTMPQPISAKAKEITDKYGIPYEKSSAYLLQEKGATLDELKQYRRGTEEASFAPTYTSSHFTDIPNYVAHMRLNERKDASGKDGLFIEELQSDRHQQGREKGYAGENLPDTTGWRAERQTRDFIPVDKWPWIVLDNDGMQVGESVIGGSQAQTEQEAINVAAKKQAGTGIPDAPFRKDWPVQMFKRALRDAIASGKEWIGWTSGDTQAERYDLSKQVDSIEVIKSGDNKYHVTAYKYGNDVVSDPNVSQDKLPDMIGKELANKAIEQINSSKDPETELANFSGVDLKVGGEGMKGFYDQILPKEIGKYVKKWGAKVEQDEIGQSMSAEDMDMGDISDATPEELAQLEAQGKVFGPPVKIWKVEITPEMRESIQKGGQLQFMPKGAEEETKNLVAVHNLSEENLRNVLKVGGLAVPSVAVIRNDRSDFTSFGEITLVAPYSMVDPKRDSKAKVFNADVYSPRYPRVDYFMPDKKANRELLASIKESLDKMPADLRKRFFASIETEQSDRPMRERFTEDPVFIAAFLSDVGKIGDVKFDIPQEERYADQSARWNVREFMRSNPDLKEEFNNWMESKLDDAGVTEEEKLFAGYTPSGTRRYVPHTLDNVVKMMAKSIRDGEGPNYGVGSVRSKAAKQFRTLDQVKGSREQIVSKDRMEELKAEVNDEFEQLAQESIKLRKVQRDFYFDQIADDMKALAEGGSENMNYLIEQYPNGAPFEKWRDYLEKLRNLPTEYFEAKIQRGVGLDEFAGAVVPRETSQDVIESLQKQGLEVIKYDERNAGSRAQAIRDIGARRSDIAFMPSEGESNPVPTQEELDKMKARLPKYTPEIEEYSEGRFSIRIYNQDNKYVGMVEAQYRPEAGGYIDVYDSGVESAYRKQGYGEALYRELAKYAQSKGAETIEGSPVSEQAVKTRSKLLETTTKGEAPEYSWAGSKVPSDIRFMPKSEQEPEGIDWNGLKFAADAFAKAPENPLAGLALPKTKIPDLVFMPKQKEEGVLVDKGDNTSLPVYQKTKNGKPVLKKGDPVYVQQKYNLVNAPALTQYDGPKAEDTTLPDYKSLAYDVTGPQQKKINAAIQSGAVDSLANGVVERTNKYLENPEIAAGKGWYSRMRENLLNALGEDGRELLSQLLGATSAKTPVNQNFLQAMDAYEGIKSGRYDENRRAYIEMLAATQDGTLNDLISERGYSDSVKKMADDLSKGARKLSGKKKDQALGAAKDLRDLIKIAPENRTPKQSQKIMMLATNMIPMRSNGRKFNANSMAVLKVIGGTWLANRNSPKTPNFAGNLSGRTIQATIDVWAARFLRQLMYEGYGDPWRIQPKAETGVSNEDFALGQIIFERAGRKLGMNPDDLQAVLWFAEKHNWEDRGWTKNEGAEKSSFDEIFHVFFPKGKKPLSFEEASKIFKDKQAESDEEIIDEDEEE